MKKFFRRIAIVVSLICLFTAPCTAMAGSSSPTLIIDTSSIRGYQYRPDPLNIKNQFMYIGDIMNQNYTDGWWHVSAGQQFTFSLTFTQTSHFNYMVTVNDNSIVYSQNVYADGFSCNTGVLPSDSIVKVYVWNDDSTDAYLYRYQGTWQ